MAKWAQIYALYFVINNVAYIIQFYAENSYGG